MDTFMGVTPLLSFAFSGALRSILVYLIFYFYILYVLIDWYTENIHIYLSIYLYSSYLFKKNRKHSDINDITKKNKSGGARFEVGGPKL